MNQSDYDLIASALAKAQIIEDTDFGQAIQFGAVLRYIAAALDDNDPDNFDSMRFIRLASAIANPDL